MVPGCGGVTDNINICDLQAFVGPPAAIQSCSRPAHLWLVPVQRTSPLTNNHSFVPRISIRLVVSHEALRQFRLVHT
jgi:hypothetical protein